MRRGFKTFAAVGGYNFIDQKKKEVIRAELGTHNLRSKIKERTATYSKACKVLRCKRTALFGHYQKQRGSNRTNESFGAGTA